MTIPKRFVTMPGLLAMCWCASAQETPGRHEIGLTLGAVLGGGRTGGPIRLDLSSGAALQANYGYRLIEGRKATLYGEVHLLANPLRDVASANQALTSNVSALFVTPGLRVKFRPRAAIAPYLAVGGGWALFEQSTGRLDGQPNGAPRTISRGAFDFGGGADFKFWRFVGLRGEIRDFYTGSPAYNTASLTGGQHNVVVGGGIVLKFQ